MSTWRKDLLLKTRVAVACPARSARRTRGRLTGQSRVAAASRHPTTKLLYSEAGVPKNAQITIFLQRFCTQYSNSKACKVLFFRNL